ncbi:MAG TPA: FeoA family protein [Ilumatobacteraceae bacterium]|nr:FeoA family protein [Ilumatobacteraceae bacterium]
MVDITEMLRRRTVSAATGTAAGQLTLADLRPGQRGVIVGLDDSHVAATMRRLCDLGFTLGAFVEVLRRAPLGDPTLFRVKHYEIALRRSEARRILIEPSDRAAEQHRGSAQAG